MFAAGRGELQVGGPGFPEPERGISRCGRAPHLRPAPVFQWRQFRRPRLWSEIEDPVATFNHFEIVLDYDQRMPGIDEPLEQLQQHRDVVEMQAGGWFIKDEEISARFF